MTGRRRVPDRAGRRRTAAAAAGLGLTLTATALAAWLSAGAQASAANLSLSVKGDDPSATLSADGKSLTFGPRGPLGSVFAFQHTVTVSNTGDTGGTGEISLGSAPGSSAALAEELRSRVVQVLPTARTLVDARLRVGGTSTLNLPAHSLVTVVVSFALNCLPLGTQSCPDVSGQSVTAVLKLVQTAVPVVITATRGTSSPQPVRIETTPPSAPPTAVVSPTAAPTSLPTTTPTTTPTPTPTTTTPPENPVLFTGGGGTLSGTNCPPGSVVRFSVNGLPAGTSTAAADGTFTGDVQLQESLAGRFPVVVTCGDRTQTTTVDLAISTSAAVSAAFGAAAGVVLLFFILLGTLLYGRFSEVGRNTPRPDSEA